MNTPKSQNPEGLVVAFDPIAKLKRCYTHIRQRCYNVKNNRYARYGGRGIIVCDRWLKSFDDFAADMGLPQKEDTIDRINNDGNYEPSNCRWATRFEQSQNKENGGFARLNLAKTECVHGHPLSGDNLRITADGVRECKACQNRMSLNNKKWKRSADRTALAGLRHRIEALVASWNEIGSYTHPVADDYKAGQIRAYGAAAKELNALLIPLPRGKQSTLLRDGKGDGVSTAEGEGK